MSDRTIAAIALAVAGGAVGWILARRQSRCAPVAVHSDKYPKAIGPYSQAIRAGNLLFMSGMIGMDPVTGNFPSEDVAAQLKQALENMKVVLEEAGISYDRVVKCTVFLTDMADYAAVNDMYSQYFTTKPFPARSCIAVKALPRGARVEIEGIAML